MTETAENSWRSLFRIGAVLLPLAGLLGIAYGVLYNVYEYAGYTGYTATGGFVQAQLDYIGNNAFLFNSTNTLLALTILAFLPAVLALYVALRRTDIGISIVGTAFTIAGIGIILSNVPQSFFQVQEAGVWDSGCSLCGTYPLAAAAGTYSFYNADQIGFLIILVGVIILSAVMLKGSTFSKISGILGLLAGFEGIIGSFAFASLSGTAAEVTSVLPFVLITLWAVSISPRMIKL